MKTTGIYQIKNLINEKIYIGSSINIKRRWSEHKGRLKNNKSNSPHLQNAYNKYGVENFEYSILLECEEKCLYYFENLFIFNYKPEYNSMLSSGERLTVSEETRKKLSDIGKNKIFTEEHRKNLSKAGKGRKLSPEHCKKIGDVHRGKIMSQESRDKMRESRKGRVVKQETRDKVSKIHKGKIVSEKTKQKMRESRPSSISCKFINKITGEEIVGISLRDLARKTDINRDLIKRLYYNKGVSKKFTDIYSVVKL